MNGEIDREEREEIVDSLNINGIEDEVIGKIVESIGENTRDKLK